MKERFYYEKEKYNTIKLIINGIPYAEHSFFRGTGR